MVPPMIPAGMWRDQAAYAGITARGRPALAWELLRRDRAYLSSSPTGAGHGIVDAAPEVAVRRWGLVFPLRPLPR